ncbi:MAG: RHS domain-containing protein, partial [Candidatus Aenigmatarchaeota archaeon]
KTYDDVLNDGNNYAYRIFKNVPTEGLFFYHTDHLMTPLQMTDESQSIVWQAEYYPFGRIYNQFGDTENNLRFPGQYTDYHISNSNLYYNGFRWYNYNIGRYYLEEANPYTYSFNNPLKYYDFYGLKKCRSGECKDCPKGEWAFFGFGVEGMVIFYGRTTYHGRLICKSKTQTYCNITYTCKRYGIGLYGSIFFTYSNIGYEKTNEILTYKAYCIEDIEGPTWGVFGTAGIGIYSGATSVETSSGYISGGSGSLGIGLGAGAGAQKCEIVSKSCYKK